MVENPRLKTVMKEVIGSNNLAMKIIFQRHGAYDNRKPGKDDIPEEELERVGWLTEEGARKSRVKARERIGLIVDAATKLNKRQRLLLMK